LEEVFIWLFGVDELGI